MAVLSCGVVLMSPGYRPFVPCARSSRSSLIAVLAPARRRSGATAPARRPRTDVRLGSAGPPGAPRPAPHPLLGRGRDRAGVAGHPLLGRRRPTTTTTSTAWSRSATWSFVTQASRISADEADFDTRTRTGTFFNAFGSASVSDKVDRSFFGSQEPDAFFYGETHREARRRPLPHHQGRLHHLRPADAALGSDAPARSR